MNGRRWNWIWDPSSNKPARLIFWACDFLNSETFKLLHLWKLHKQWLMSAKWQSNNISIAKSNFLTVNYLLINLYLYYFSANNQVLVILPLLIQCLLGVSLGAIHTCMIHPITIPHLVYWIQGSSKMPPNGTQESCQICTIVNSGSVVNLCND